MASKGKRGRELDKALAYFRTSSAANVGEDKDSLARQRAAVERYAKGAGIQIVGEYYDAAVSGGDPVETRDGFAEMLSRIESNGVGLVLVEDASRFARTVIAQELGVLIMSGRGVRVVTASGDDLTNTDDPTKVLMRQVAGAFSQYEKTRIVNKLKGARDRASAKLGRRVEGRKGYAAKSPALIREAKRLRRVNPATGKQRSYREISDTLAQAGHATVTGRPFSAAQVKRLVTGKAA